MFLSNSFVKTGGKSLRFSSIHRGSPLYRESLVTAYYVMSLFFTGAKYRNPNPHISTYNSKVNCTRYDVPNEVKKMH